MPSFTLLNKRRPGQRRCRWIAAVLAGVLLAASPGAIAVAQVPAPTFVLSGGGWGHGLGMSQWGAKGQADAGRTADQILTYYYQGAAITAGTMPSEVRTGVLWDIPSIDVTGSGPFELRYGAPDGELLATGVAGQTFTVSSDLLGNLIVTGKDLAVIRPGAVKALFVVYAPQGTLLRLPQTGDRYKYGNLEIDTYLKATSWLVRGIVTGMTMQQYLYGLGEVPSSWADEALKAQAIAGRTYAAEKVGRLGQSRPPCNCGMYPSTVDQVYVGYEKEAGVSGDRWRAAVDATDGQVLTSNSKLIEAVFHSDSGGYTENNEFVWGGNPLPYLRGEPDPWDASPRRSWTVRLSQQQLASLLNANPSTAVGVPEKVEVLDPAGVSGRVRSVLSPTTGGVRITGTDGTKRVSGAAFTRAVGLLSTLFWAGEPRPDAPVPAATIAPVVAPSAPDAQTPNGPPPAALAPAAPPMPHPNGTLIKGSSATYYLLQDGKKRPMGSKVYANRFGTSAPITVSDSELAVYPMGARLGFRDGTLLAEPGQPVWLISDGKRRGFTSAAVLSKSGYPASRVLKVAKGDSKVNEEGAPISDPAQAPFNGTVVKGAAAQLYLIDAGTKRPITSPKVFDSRFRKADVVTMKDATLKRFPNGPGVGFGDGTVIRTPDGTISVISDGKRRPITSMDRFKALKLPASKVRAVSNAEAALNPLGDVL